MRKRARTATIRSIAAFGLLAAMTVSAAADPDTTVNSVNKRNMYLPQQKFSVDFGLSAQSADSDVTQSSGGTVFYNADKTDNEAISSVGIDYRLPLAFFFPNIGNLIFGNVDTVNRGPIYPKGPIVGVWGRAFLGGTDQTESDFDVQINPNGVDTFSQYSRNFFFLPYVGYEFGVNLGGSTYGDLTVFGGPRIEQRKARLMTNESGNWYTFSDTQTDVGFTLGADLDIEFDMANLGNIGFAQTPFGPVPFIRFGAALDYTPDIEVSGISTGSGFTYESEIDGGVTPRFFVGVGLKF